MITFLIVIGFIVLVGLAQMKLDLMIWRHRGHAKPDHPDDDNPPVITGGTDALSQIQLNRIDPPKESKK